jgi:hypothetical protein
MIRSSLEYLKLVFQTPPKMILDHRIYQTTENYEQAMGRHVLKTRYCLVQEFACKKLFRERLQLG